MNRGDLFATFRISMNQASSDLNRHIALAPTNMAYDKSGRHNARTAEFESLFLKRAASRYLSQLRSVADGILNYTDAWIGLFSYYDAAPKSVEGVDTRSLRSVAAATLQSQAIEIKYQSLSRPELRWRWIPKHAIGFDGFRQGKNKVRRALFNYALKRLGLDTDWSSARQSQDQQFVLISRYEILGSRS